jgi:hypothetical protein
MEIVLSFKTLASIRHITECHKTEERCHKVIQYGGFKVRHIELRKVHKEAKNVPIPSRSTNPSLPKTFFT